MMNMMNWPTELVSQMLPILPPLLFWMIAMGIALGKWSRYPRVCLLVFLAALVALINLIVGQLAAFGIMQLRAMPQWQGLDLQSAFLGLSLVRSLVGVIALSLLLAAVFASRESDAIGSEAEPRPYPSPADAEE